MHNIIDFLFKRSAGIIIRLLTVNEDYLFDDSNYLIIYLFNDSKCLFFHLVIVIQ